MNWYVEIVRLDTDEAVKRYGPHDLARAEQIEALMVGHLDPALHYTRVAEGAETSS